MIDTKSILSSRAIWANLIGLAAFLLSLVGIDSSGIDQAGLVTAILNCIAGGGFILGAVFRTFATHKLR